MTTRTHSRSGPSHGWRPAKVTPGTRAPCLYNEIRNFGPPPQATIDKRSVTMRSRKLKVTLPKLKFMEGSEEP